MNGMLVRRSHQLYENSCFSQCACHHEKKNLVFSVIFADKRKSPRKSLEKSFNYNISQKEALRATVQVCELIGGKHV